MSVDNIGFSLSKADNFSVMVMNCNLNIQWGLIQGHLSRPLLLYFANRFEPATPQMQGEHFTTVLTRCLTSLNVAIFVWYSFTWIKLYKQFKTATKP